MALETVWNGNVHTESRGYLCVVPEPTRSAPPLMIGRAFRKAAAARLPKLAKPGATQAIILAALKQQPCTQADLQRLGKLTASQVTNGIHKLKCRGDIRRVGMVRNRMGRPSFVYVLRGDPVRQSDGPCPCGGKLVDR